MNEIKCPKCGEIFQVDEAGYADIQKQIRDKEFNREIEDRIHLIEKSQKDEIKLVESELKAKLDKAEIEKNLAVAEAIAKVEKDRDKLSNEIIIKDAEAKLLETTLKDKYEGELRLKDETIDRLKDMKVKLSTKMVGETLEQHCENEFNKLRATAFQNAYFEKDNDAKEGTKGDYIFRDKDDNGTEFISIMFEMKNENEATATKHRNEDFFKKLDEDRNKKGCEYAILVSLLEADSELYNTGIVDVSYRYPKMYVIRPQFFIQIITLLRNAAQNSLQYKTELAIIRNQNIDITNFESELNIFKTGFAKNVEQAGKKFDSAIAEIDKAIASLQKTKEALTTTNKHLLTANNRTEKLTIKKLTKNNPTMTDMFADLEEN
ncbi:MAG: DUF2130 domain-containing protein [Lactobacillales bacterium]|jgi:hypothetical protein|nr:DUF2130 domain-containing protein [Lactobacillales bacterium]